MPKFLIDELNKLKELKNPKPTDFIFGNDLPTNERRLDLARDKYTKLARENYKKEALENFKEEDLLKRIRIHDFRHSHVAFLISENVDVVTIANRIGDRIETVLKTYAHLMPNKQIEMINKLENSHVSIRKNTIL